MNILYQASLKEAQEFRPISVEEFEALSVEMQKLLARGAVMVVQNTLRKVSILGESLENL